MEMLVVGDDCALPPSRLVGRRGIAGTVFVHKVAGASAAAGDDLATVLAKARATAQSVGSMGVATSVCTVPGSKPADPPRYCRAPAYCSAKKSFFKTISSWPSAMPRAVGIPSARLGQHVPW